MSVKNYCDRCDTEIDGARDWHALTYGTEITQGLDEGKLTICAGCARDLTAFLLSGKPMNWLERRKFRRDARRRLARQRESDRAKKLMGHYE